MEILSRVHFAGFDNVLFFIQVVLVVLGVAAAAFERWRRLKEVPQSPAADLTVGWKMIEREDKLVAPVADEGAAITMWHGFQWSILFMPDVVFTVILYLWNFSDICRVHITVTYRSDTNQLTETGREMEKLSLVLT